MRIDNYELLELIAQDLERESFKARDRSNSRDVIVHVLRPLSDSERREPDLAELGKSLPTDRQPSDLVFAGELEGKFYIITEARAECYDVRKWLEQQSTKNSESQSSAELLSRAGLWKVPPANTPASHEQGEVTRLFQTRPDDALPQSNPAEDSRSDSHEESSLAKPGTFTAMFLPTHEKPPLEPNSMQTAGFSKEQGSAELGDSTRISAIRSNSDPQTGQDLTLPEASQPTGPARSDGSDFTRMFKAVRAPEETDVDRSKATAELRENRNAAPGDFTRIFQTHEKGTPSQDSTFPEALQPTVQGSSDGSDFTRMFKAVRGSEETAVDDSKAAAELRENRNAASGDFTRIFQAHEKGTPSQDSTFPEALQPTVQGSSDVSDFTRIFKAVPGPEQLGIDRSKVDARLTEDLQNDTPQAVPQSENSAATGIFTTEKANERQPMYEHPAGPSDYTQVIAIPVVPKPSNAAVPQPQPAEVQSAPTVTPKPPSYLPLILIMNGLFLAALVLIVYFVLKK